jgi:hypothetical protein
MLTTIQSILRKKGIKLGLLFSLTAVFALTAAGLGVYSYTQNEQEAKAQNWDIVLDLSKPKDQQFCVYGNPFPKDYKVSYSFNNSTPVEILNPYNSETYNGICFPNQPGSAKVHVTTNVGAYVYSESFRAENSTYNRPSYEHFEVNLNNPTAGQVTGGDQYNLREKIYFGLEGYNNNPSQVGNGQVCAYNVPTDSTVRFYNQGVSVNVPANGGTTACDTNKQGSFYIEVFDSNGNLIKKGTVS